VCRDLSVVSGDSLGHVTVWDGRFGSQIRSFTSHTADVMGLHALPDISLDGKPEHAFVSCSLDGKVVCYQSSVSGRGEVSGCVAAVETPAVFYATLAPLALRRNFGR
jgi:WD40 repeat protein